MTDMLGTTIAVGDTVLFPGGNARYGGLKMMVGVVQRMTPKRISLLHCPLDGSKDPKPTAKTGAKILISACSSLLNSVVVNNLKAEISSD